MTVSENAITGATFLTRFFAGTSEYIEIRVIDQEGKVRQCFNRSPEVIGAVIEENLNLGRNIYFGLCTRDGRGGKKENCKEVVALWADLDCKDISLDEGLLRIEGFTPAPSLAVSSGGGLHVYWRLARPAPADKSIEPVLKGLTAALGADPAAAELARVLRVPGTKNFKPKYGEPRDVVLLREDWDRRYQPEDFAAFAVPVASNGNRTAEPGRGEKIKEGGRYTALIKEVGRLWQRGSYSKALTVKMGIEWAKENFDLGGADFDEAMVTKEIANLVNAYTPGDGTASEIVAWGEPEELGDDLPPVPAFELGMLPDAFRPLVEDVSERMQTPPDFAGASAVVGLGGSVGRRASIRPKREDYSWDVIPNLWGDIIAPPGYMKSPVMQAVLRPLANVEETWRANSVSEIEQYERELEKKKLDHEVWKQQYKAAKKDSSKPMPPEPDVTLVEPAKRRLLVMDATVEKLHEMLVENPTGVLVLRDELVGLIAEMDKEGSEAQRAFYLSSWNGYGAHTIDRIGRGTVVVPNVCLSLFGLIQPARLRHYFADMLDGGPGDDGLFQRFQIAVWPDVSRDWRLVDRPPNNTALAKAEKVFSRLANLPAESVRMRFDPEAQDFFFAWWRELEEKVRGENGLYPALVSHLSKYRKLFPTLAGLFELADYAARDGPFDDVETSIAISLAHAEQAAKMCAYLEKHAVRIYSCVITPELHAARELAKHIKRGDLETPFTARTVYKKNWSALETSERVAGALEILEDGGWIRRKDKPRSRAGGRPPDLWEINPKLR